MSSNLFVIDFLWNDFAADSHNTDPTSDEITIPLALYVLTSIDRIKYFFSQFCSRHIFQLLALNFYSSLFSSSFSQALSALG